MEETELEEGEAFFDDNDASIDIDPDTAFSYIDERLQNVLGHFQKDFEGGLSAEILGPKYGGYGSFLPAQKQFRTVHSHTKTPQRALNSNEPHSPDNLHVESALENPVAPSVPILAVRPDVDSVSKYRSSLLVSSSETCLSKNETSKSKLGNPTEQRSLKVRIKVGSDKSARKNDAIYSGLGLLSPSSSTGNTEDSDGLPIESHDVPLDSPSNILHEMTSSFLPGNRLLSPLNENLLCLTRTEKISESKCMPPILGGKDDSSYVLGQEKLMEGKDASSRDKSEIPEGIKYKNTTGSVGDKAPFSSDSVHSTVGMLNAAVTTSAANQAAKKDMPVKKRATKKDWINDQLFGPDFTCKESEQEDVKHSTIEHDEETKAMASTKKLSLGSIGSDRIKGNMTRSVCKIDPDISKHETDPVEKKVGPAVPLAVGKLPFERKNKVRGIQSSGFSTSKLVKENSRSGFKGAMKDMKNAQKEIVKVRDSYKYILDTTVEDQHNRTKPLETPTGIGPNHCELGTIKGKTVPKNRVSAEVIVPPPMEVAPAAPPDNWVACDRCEKWRLLPVGIETKDLPDKWMCSMSTWLPGMNYCDISEDETTRVVQEINLYLISQNQNIHQYGSGAISGLATFNVGPSDHSNSNVNLVTMVNRPIKSKSRPEGSSSSLIHTSHSSIDSQQHRQKRKSSSEANQQLLEKNVVNNSVGLHPSKLSTVTIGRPAANIIDKDVNEGDLKPKRLKSKAGSDHYDDLSNGDHRPMDGLAISVKRQTENIQVSMKSNLSDMKSSEKVEMHAKKRKLKDVQESQPYANASESREENSDIIRRKEKRLKTANTEVKEIAAIKRKTMKIILSGSRENSVDRRHEKNQQQDKHTENITSRSNLNDSERFLLSATSSSSKVSDSRRRPNLQERKGSPVESVSSLPAAGKTISRKTGTEIPRKLLAKEDNKELHDIDASQRFCGRVDLKHKESSKIRNIHMIKYDSDAVMGATSQSDGRISMKDDSNGKKISSFQRVKAKASDPLTEQEPVLNKMRRVEADVVNRSPSMNPDIVGDGKQKYSNESSAKIIRQWPGDNIGDEKPFDEKLGDVGCLEVMTTVKMDLRNVSAVKLSKKTDGIPCSAAKKSESALFHHPPSRSLEISNSDVSGHNVLKVSKHPRDAANQNAKNMVTDCGTGTIKDLGVLSFVKEYASSQTAMTAFRRAEESKDYADRIKISGFDYECKDAYFNSALKFLYAASLLEACNTDFSKSKGVEPGNGYSTAAKLCKTCAQEYEKEKEMAAATLAYKCMEVACMRIVYCKSSVTRQDLQTSLQMVNLGESPSSSASDVDNLNNQATMDKTMLSKSIAPPGNHAVARNQAYFLRLLDLTSDVNLAMEASMNTQNAYAAASAIIEAQNKEMIISVKRVVDFSFQDVKEFVCLVQHAREAINRQGFRGNKE